MHGIDIDPRAVQIAALALWMRAQRAYNGFGIDRGKRLPIVKTNIVVAEPMPGEKELRDEFIASLDKQQFPLMTYDSYTTPCRRGLLEPFDYPFVSF